MAPLLIAFATFLCLTGASFGCMLVYSRLPERLQRDDTHNVIKLVATIFVTMTSMAIGLLINSSKTTFDAIDHNVHSFATEIIILDRSLRAHGPDTAEARAKLASYVERAVAGTWPRDAVGRDVTVEDEAAEAQLDEVGAAMRKIEADEPEDLQLKAEWRQRFQKITELRWTLIQHWEGTMPPQLIVVLVGWVSLIFASFAYRAPPNVVVAVWMTAGAALISAALYLILDMDAPFSGWIRVSPAALETALEHMRR
ncbi:DUF4239 domain-containing protein [Chenggangzhangella methanolivorans]|uniref:DUF4239 domain-containing protein n=1 Tax=Chenggangzhangella methanolivorans TaxID=1437009 RepID=A0A9E6UMK9_9HYPH|nr:DUF4239 domain-containing protein [Chenggangzhangella methanolivorans]QZN99298.1 DUF4239 domain-containing protein [Chenggangzhangella methanolivorans]